MRLNLSRLASVVSPLPILIACAASGATAQSANVITAPELARSGATNTYDAIRQTRPELLREREPGSLMLFSARHPAVAVDNVLVGGIETLQAIPPGDVARIEYVSAWKATKKYGPGFHEGIMLVQKKTESEVDLSSRKVAP
ncbi:MAG TPA: Plug domain-containing protein [Gemmatimonadales bacterium]|nr:Plug domain-containing protein [Gemmatimonadales bacterium]